jgi:hypothetical protein
MFQTCKEISRRCTFADSLENRLKVTLTVAFDFPNHGVNFRDTSLNRGWTFNDKHGIDMWMQQ